VRSLKLSLLHLDRLCASNAALQSPYYLCFVNAVLVNWARGSGFRLQASGLRAKQTSLQRLANWGGCVNSHYSPVCLLASAQVRYIRLAATYSHWMRVG
jgi:hypothetical protein